MKSKCLRELLMGMIVILAFSNMAWAGNSASIAVSCSIPEVPGLNAPPFLEKTVLIEPNNPKPKGTKIAQEEAQGEATNTVIEEESEKKILLAEGKSGSVIVQTIYSR